MVDIKKQYIGKLRLAICDKTFIPKLIKQFSNVETLLQRRHDMNMESLKKELETFYNKELRIKEAVTKKAEAQKARVLETEAFLHKQRAEQKELRKCKLAAELESQKRQYIKLTQASLQLAHLKNKISFIQTEKSQSIAELRSKLDKCILHQKQEQTPKIQQLNRELLRLKKKQMKLPTNFKRQDRALLDLDPETIDVGNIDDERQRLKTLQRVDRQARAKFKHMFSRRQKLAQQYQQKLSELQFKQIDLRKKQRGLKISAEIVKEITDKLNGIGFKDTYNKRELASKLRQCLSQWKSNNQKKLQELGRYSEMFRQLSQILDIQSTTIYKQLAQPSLFQIHQTIMHQNQFLMEADKIFKQSFQKLATEYDNICHFVKKHSSQLMAQNRELRAEIQTKKRILAKSMSQLQALRSRKILEARESAHMYGLTSRPKIQSQLVSHSTKNIYLSSQRLHTIQPESQPKRLRPIKSQSKYKIN